MLFLSLTSYSFLPLQCLWTLFCFPHSTNDHFYFSALLFISPRCTWGALYLYNATLFVNDKLSLTNYFAGILLPCHYFISNNLLQLLAGKKRNKTHCMAMFWDPKYRNTELFPTNMLPFFLPHITSSHRYIWKRLEKIIGRALTVDFSALKTEICLFRLHYFE